MGWLPTTIKRWDFCPAFYGGKEMKIMQIITLILIALILANLVENLLPSVKKGMKKLFNKEA